jgi:predicted RNA-binding protein
MCLSTVYPSSGAQTDIPLARNVTSVRVVDGKIILTDLMGEISEIPGAIEQIDLIKNFITISCRAIV